MTSKKELQRTIHYLEDLKESGCSVPDFLEDLGEKLQKKVLDITSLHLGKRKLSDTLRFLNGLNIQIQSNVTIENLIDYRNSDKRDPKLYRFYVGLLNEDLLSFLDTTDIYFSHFLHLIISNNKYKIRAIEIQKEPEEPQKEPEKPQESVYVLIGEYEGDYDDFYERPTEVLTVSNSKQVLEERKKLYKDTYIDFIIAKVPLLKE